MCRRAGSSSRAHNHRSQLNFVNITLPTSIQLVGRCRDRGMVCSLVRSQSSVLVGCRDGTLIEIDVKKLKIRREMRMEYSIATITALWDDVIVVG